MRLSNPPNTTARAAKMKITMPTKAMAKPLLAFFRVFPMDKLLSCENILAHLQKVEQKSTPLCAVFDQKEEPKHKKASDLGVLGGYVSFLKGASLIHFFALRALCAI